MIRRVATILACMALAAGSVSTVAAQGGKEAAQKVSENPKVLMKTSAGDLVIELYPDKAPKTVANFLAYVNEGFYDGTIFHRIIDGFVIQGGGFTPDMKQKPTHDPVENEAHNGLKNTKYTLSMARTPAIHSATSQFFINLVDNKSLDHRDKSDRGYGYAVFGKVVEGMNVVDELGKVATTTKGRYADVPVETVSIVKASVVGDEEK